jgi:hypothetical protein
MLEGGAVSNVDRTERIGWLTVWTLMIVAAVLKVAAFLLGEAGL